MGESTSADELRAGVLAVGRLVDDPLLLVRDGVIEAATPAAARLLGAPPGDVEGRALHTLSSEPAAVGELLARAGRSTAPLPGRIALPSGGSLRCEAAAVAADDARLVLRIWSSDADPLLLLGQKVEELAHEVLRRKQAQAAAEEALAARDAFLTMASHDLRTPLTSLKVHVESALRELEKGEVPGEPRWRAVQKQANRLERLVRNLLDVTRIQQGRLVVAQEEIDVGAVVGEVVGRLTDEARRAGCELRLAVVPSEPGRFDPDALEQILINLLTNAFRHAPGAAVHVSVGGDHEQVLLEVADEGPGIPLADQRRIFQRFERIGAGVRGGMGIGLWIVQALVAAHGGSVAVDSAPGHGTRFVIALPRAMAAAS